MEIVDSGDVVRFVKGVRMTLMLNGQPLDKGSIKAGGAAQ
jgi:hypothetical protein